MPFLKSAAGRFLFGVVTSALLIAAIFIVLGAVQQRREGLTAQRVFNANRFPFLTYRCVGGSKGGSAVELKRSLYCSATYDPRRNKRASANATIDVAIVASPTQLDVVKVDNNEFPANEPGENSWLLTPKVSGPLNYVLRFHEMQGKNEIADISDDYEVESYENVFNPAFFDSHGFAASIIASLIPLLLGLVTARLGGQSK